jgi:hypothetical protein
MKPTNDKVPYESRLLEDLDPKLAEVVAEAEKQFDKQFASEVNVFTTCTHRNNARQEQLFAQRPKVTWARGGQSPHNKYPSQAWDVAFINTATKKLDWSSKWFDAYNAIVKKVAKAKGVEITWGSDWNRDNIKDKVKQDAPHHEATNWRTK